MSGNGPHMSEEKSSYEWKYSSHEKSSKGFHVGVAFLLSVRWERHIRQAQSPNLHIIPWGIVCRPWDHISIARGTLAYGHLSLSHRFRKIQKSFTSFALTPFPTSLKTQLLATSVSLWGEAPQQHSFHFIVACSLLCLDTSAAMFCPSAWCICPHPPLACARTRIRTPPLEPPT